MLSTKTLVLSAVLIALTVVLGLIFLSVPNVELFTASVFISGYILGPVGGAVVGALAELIFSLFNPMGAPVPPLLLAQIAAMALAGWVGGWFASHFQVTTYRLRIAVMTGLLGLGITLLFDIVTTLSFSVLMAGGDLRKIAANFIYGMAFYVIHLLVNTMVFATLVPLLLGRLPSIPFPSTRQ
jgi:uncharacterized membrane protein